MFDRVDIRVRGGDGGNGAITFRREKFVPYGGPDGGDGGNGGDVVIMADSSFTDLRQYRPGTLHKAGEGGNGQGNNKHGKKSGDLLLKVPLGTLVSRSNDAGLCMLCDLEKEGQQTVVARGGRGGRGNTRFKSSTNQAPEVAEKGEEGQELRIVLEMRLIADVGIIGYPNVGKSSLLAAASAAKPKVADYPFTTLEPVLGVVNVGDDSFVLAEIPGLIESAYLGKGLGHEFLRHALRTRLLIHLLDGSSASPVEDMIKVNLELGKFDVALSVKPQIVAVNKLDLPAVSSRRGEIESAFESVGITAHFVSAVSGEGIKELMSAALDLLHRILGEQESSRGPEAVLRPHPRRIAVSACRQSDGVFVVTAPALERVVGRQGESSPELLAHIRNRLDRMGVRRPLLRAGIKPGDRVRYSDLEWVWWEQE